MRVFALLSVFIAFPLANGTFRATGEADFWLNTRIDKAFTARFVSNSICAQDQDMERACERAVERLARREEKLKVPRTPVGGTDYDAVLESIDTQVLRYPKAMNFGHLISDVLQWFDAHAQIRPVALFDARFSSRSYEEIGTGAIIQADDTGVYVRDLYPRSPAEVFGVRVHDRILAVNGRFVEPGLRGYLTVLDARAELGDQIRYRLMRGSRVLEITLDVARLARPNLVARAIFSRNGDRGLHVRVHGFNRGTCLSVLGAVSGAGASTQFVILDLRGNRGGIADEGACVASLFTGKKGLVRRERITDSPLTRFNLNLKDHEVELEWYGIYERPVFAKLPLVVLLDAGSASSSEIVAGSLQDAGRAVLVGDRTFGKGTTQLLSYLDPRQTVFIAHTVTRFVRADGSAIQGIGVGPDLAVAARPGGARALPASPRELDFYPNAVRFAGVGEPPLDPAAIQPSARTCLAKSRGDRRHTVQARRFMGHPDPQLARGLDAFQCVHAPET